MEWVETTGTSVAEAKSVALDQLGIAEDDAEFEVVEEPKAGLFGRTRGEARVRARVRPTILRGKPERRPRASTDKRKESSPSRSKDGPRKERANSAVPNRTRERPAVRDTTDRPPVDPDKVGEVAATFLTGITEAFGYKGSVAVKREEEDIEVTVDGDELGLMVGPRGATLLAIQDLTRVVSQRRLGDQVTRLRIDIAGYRERRREALSRFAAKVAQEVKESGEARILEPMMSADRKIVHDSLAEFEGVTTHSQGEDPQRRVVVEPVTAD
ncbi:MAG: KH domain-containing protein [Ilumatobacteraceae bacterium]|nr:KH domain-containing protein [Ilumatobacteraceae bacterium]